MCLLSKAIGRLALLGITADAPYEVTEYRGEGME